MNLYPVRLSKLQTEQGIQPRAKAHFNNMNESSFVRNLSQPGLNKYMVGFRQRTTDGMIMLAAFFMIQRKGAILSKYGFHDFFGKNYGEKSDGYASKLRKASFLRKPFLEAVSAKWQMPDTIPRYGGKQFLLFLVLL